MPDSRILTQNLDKMRTHFTCLTELENNIGDLQSAARLREVLKQNCLLLGLEANKNKNFQIEMTTLKRAYERLRKDKTDL